MFQSSKTAREYVPSTDYENRVLVKLGIARNQLFPTYKGCSLLFGSL